MPSLCGREATPVVQAFAIHSVLAYRPLRPRGVRSSLARSDDRRGLAIGRRHSQNPAIRFTRERTFVASWFTHLLRSPLLAPCTDRPVAQPAGLLHPGCPAGWSPFPLPDITTTATELLCWRDSHPLEWQLASLHLLLHRDGLAPSTPCRSPGALRVTPESGRCSM